MWCASCATVKFVIIVKLVPGVQGATRRRDPSQHKILQRNNLTFIIY